MSRVIVTADQTAELAHSGRKGMKWYQHIFGEEDSRAAYNHGSGSDAKGTNSTTDGDKAKRNYNKFNISKASDKELQDYIQRKNLEEQYLNKAFPKTAVQRILSRAGDTLIQNIGDATANVAYNLGKRAVTNTLDKISGGNEFGTKLMALTDKKPKDNDSSGSDNKKSDKSETKPQPKKQESKQNSANQPKSQPAKVVNDKKPQPVYDPNKKPRKGEVVYESTMKFNTKKRK